jgi:hypothetical protein
MSQTDHESRHQAAHAMSHEPLDEDESSLDEMVAQLEVCIQDCMDCHAICLDTINYCLEMGGDHVEAEHMRTLMDCAQICQTSADFMLRGSEWHLSTCQVCAEVCRACAESCAAFAGDEQMERLAQFCNACADSCEEMVSEAGA